MTGTQAQANKFHDDKALYTGVHAKGGPSTIDTDKVADIGNLLDRTEADVRGRKVQDGKGEKAKVTGTVVEERKKPVKKLAVVEEKKGNSTVDLKSIFNQFSGGEKEIDGKVFAKLAVDCNIVNKECSKTNVDLIFTTIKGAKARKIDFSQFK